MPVGWSIDTAGWCRRASVASDPRRLLHASHRPGFLAPRRGPSAAPQIAAADSLFGGTFGGFIPRGLDSRTVTGDVLRDLRLSQRFLTLWDVDFGQGPDQASSALSISGEVLFGFGDFVEAGVGISYTSQERDSFYTDFTDIDGTEIDQDHADAHRSA